MTALVCIINIVFISILCSVIIFYLHSFLETFYKQSEFVQSFSLPLLFSCAPIVVFIAYMDFSMLHWFGVSIPISFWGICYLICLSLIVSMYLIIHVHIVWNYLCDDIR